MGKKRTKSKKKSKTFIIIVLIIIIVGIVILFLNKNSNTDNGSLEDNSLIGVYIYDDNQTKYEFKKNGTGSMRFGDFEYKYTYIAKDGTLELDFIDDAVYDAKYTYTLDNETLTLVSVEGTVSVGQEYILKKENK